MLGEFLSVLAFLKGRVQSRAADHLRRELGVGCAAVSSTVGSVRQVCGLERFYEYLLGAWHIHEVK